jgi:hypothetical protein
MAIFAVTLGELAEVVWVSTLSAVAFTILFSVVILTSARAEEAHRAGRMPNAVGYGAAAAIAFLVFAAGVAYGVHVMLTA